MRPDEVGTEDTLRAVLDHHLESVDRLGRLPGREPVGGLLRLHAEFEAFPARFRLAQAYGRNGRNRESDAWDATIVGLVPVPFQQVRGHDLRSEDRRVGKEVVSTCRSRGPP